MVAQDSGNTQAMAAGPSGELYIGGHFSQDVTSKAKRAYFASIFYNTGQLTSWDLNATGGKMGVWALLVDDDKLHTGGLFKYFNGVQQRGVRPVLRHALTHLLGGRGPVPREGPVHGLATGDRVGSCAASVQP